MTEFKVGDRVAAFHEMMKPHGSFAEYSIAEAHTTFHIPEKTSFEEAATIPLAAMTAAVGLVRFSRLDESTSISDTSSTPNSVSPNPGLQSTPPDPSPLAA